MGALGIFWVGKAEFVRQTENDLRKGEPDLTLSWFFLGAGGWSEQVSMNDPKKWWLSSRPPWKPPLCWMKCHFYLTWSTGTASSRQVSPELGALGATGMVAPQKPGSSDLQSWGRMWLWALTSGIKQKCKCREEKIIQLQASGQVWKDGFKMELQSPEIKGKIRGLLKILKLWNLWSNELRLARDCRGNLLQENERKDLGFLVLSVFINNYCAVVKPERI